MDKKYKILIVEDEAKLLNLLKNKVEQNGWEAMMATDGEEALAKIKSEKPDLLLLDLLLPKLNGFEVLAQLRKEDPGLPVIVLTNHGNNENVSQVLDLGAEIFLVKSNYSLDEIADKIKQVLKT